MGKARRLGAVFYLGALAVLVLAGAKVYMNYIEEDHEALHAEMVERIETRLAGREAYSFAVVGNVRNSIGIFERKIVPQLNASGVDFVVSAGNAVSGGGEDKYRALHRTLGQLTPPYLLTFGEKEHGGFGGLRFYDHYGPYVFGFSAGNSRFVFLDATGKTSWEWQLRWLEEELAESPKRHVFAFCARPPRPVEDAAERFKDVEDYLLEAEARAGLERLAERSGTRAVFSAELPVYSRERVAGTDYVVTGGAGGLVKNDDRSFYHYVRVSVDGDKVEIEPVRLAIGQSELFRTLESLWLSLHSLLYVGYLNYLLGLCVALLLWIWVYRVLLADRDYYPRFDLPTDVDLDRSVKVAMFTNNFLPFIGGVPISIDRLRRSLVALGHRAMVVAPRYAEGPAAETEEEVFRVPPIFGRSGGGAVAVANIFHPGAFRAVSRFKPDLVHLHHPFWIGSLGLFVARCLRRPVVYTYHTRLENFSFAVPLPSALFRNVISHAIVRRFSNRCDAVIVPTDSAEHYLRMIGVKTQIFIQPTGIEYQRFRTVDPRAVAALRRELDLSDDPVLVCVSRLSQEKNIDFIVEAASKLYGRSSRPFTLLLIGDGPERAGVQDRIRERGAEGYIRLVGSVPQETVPLYYRLGDAFVFASQSETQGMVILEAMAAGLPVVAVRSSGIDDFITDGYNGYKTLLHSEEWGDRIDQLLGDAELRRQLSENAVQFASQYDVTEFGQKVARIYAYVLACRADARSRRVADSKLEEGAVGGDRGRHASSPPAKDDLATRS